MTQNKKVKLFVKDKGSHWRIRYENNKLDVIRLTDDPLNDIKTDLVKANKSLNGINSKFKILLNQIEAGNVEIEANRTIKNLKEYEGLASGIGILSAIIVEIFYIFYGIKTNQINSIFVGIFALTSFGIMREFTYRTISFIKEHK